MILQLVAKNSAGPKGGQKGHMPPRSDLKAYLAPRKKVNFFLSYDPKIVMKKKWSQCKLLILIQYQRDYRV